MQHRNRMLIHKADPDPDLLMPAWTKWNTSTQSIATFKLFYSSKACAATNYSTSKTAAHRRPSNQTECHLELALVDNIAPLYRIPHSLAYHTSYRGTSALLDILLLINMLAEKLI